MIAATLASPTPNPHHFLVPAAASSYSTILRPALYNPSLLPAAYNAFEFPARGPRYGAAYPYVYL